MNTNNSKVFFALVILIILIALLGAINLFFGSSARNVLSDKAIYWSDEWQKKKQGNEVLLYSNSANSEFSFAFKGSKSIGFRIHSKEKDPNIELAVKIDNKFYNITNPNINDKRLVVVPEDIKAMHTVEGKVYCISGLAKCNVEMKEILLEGGNIYHWNFENKKVLGIIGDSLSLILLSANYTAILADSMGYRLVNASRWGTTAGVDQGKFPAVSRYKKDLIAYKPDVVIVFLGINDVYFGSSIESFQQDYEVLLKGIKNNLPKAKIIAVGILPGKQADEYMYRINEFNGVIQKLAQEQRVQFADPAEWLTEEDYDDQIHPNAKGEQKIADNLTKLFQKNNIIN